jgi:hypothetical protein
MAGRDLSSAHCVLVSAPMCGERPKSSHPTASRWAGTPILANLSLTPCSTDFAGQPSVLWNCYCHVSIRVRFDQWTPHKSCGSLRCYGITFFTICSITYIGRVLLYIHGVQTDSKLPYCEDLESFFDLFSIQSLVIYCLTASGLLPHGASAKEGGLPCSRRLPRATAGLTR